MRRLLLGLLTPALICSALSLAPTAQAGAPAAPVRSATATAAATKPVVTPRSFTGYGFDTCTAPSQAAMDVWRTHSPFSAVGIYVSGNSRHCTQPNLTPEWVQTQSRNGWRLLPIHVGLQAPCTTAKKAKMSTVPSVARTQGTAAADEMIRAAKRLGIVAPSVLYLDIEWYDSSDVACNRPTLVFMNSWTKRLHEAGYKSGVYSSASAAIKALDRVRTQQRKTYVLPDQLWLAWGNGRADTDGGPYLADEGWSDHQRIHQYILDRWATHGGVPIHIDYNFLDVGKGAVAKTPRGTCDTRVSFRAYPRLEAGSRSGHVRAAQCMLKRARLYADPLGRLYDRTTKKAVRAYQRREGLPVSGAVTRRTWTALLAGGSTPLMKFGHARQATYRLQRALTAALGRSVPVTGVYDPETVSAVVEYRGRLGLESHGVAAADLWSGLAKGRIGRNPAREASRQAHRDALPGCDTCSDPAGRGLPAPH